MPARVFMRYMRSRRSISFLELQVPQIKYAEAGNIPISATDRLKVLSKPIIKMAAMDIMFVTNRTFKCL